MRAIVSNSYGSVELADVGKPTPGDEEILVEVKAAGLDRGAWHFMMGEPYLVRPFSGLTKLKQPVLGREFAGIVEQVGPSVTALAVGDEVFGVAEGTFASHTVAKPKNITKKSTKLDFEQAAALPISGITALEAVLDQAEVSNGQSVLVIGASGGVGSYCVQLAKSQGAVVTGVGSAKKHNFLRELGCDRVIDYAAGDYLAVADSYDVILDINGRQPTKNLRRSAKSDGIIVYVGGEGGNKITGGFGRGIRAAALSPLVSQSLKMFIGSESAEQLDRLNELAEASKITPAIGARFELDEAVSAFDYMAEGKAKGKIVVVL